MKLTATTAVSKFKCLQGDCPDTCCKGWSMQVDDLTFAKYQGTELESAIDYDGASKEIRVMKRDVETDYCVKFTDGICGIHAAKGADMLGDACNLYPRITRQMGEKTIMTATLSCPEIVRLALFDDERENFTEHSSDRLPANLKDYRDAELTPEQMLSVHEAFLISCNADAPAGQIMARIYSATQSLQYIERKDWEGATPFMIKMADGKLPAMEGNVEDAYRILQIFAAVFHGTKKKMNPRLAEIFSRTESAIGARLNWETLNFDQTDSSALAATIANWENNAKHYNEILKKYVKAQLSFSTFPFAGLGKDPVEKARFICYKFALMKLVLAAYAAGNKAMDETKIIQSIQSIARVIDHISDPTLVMNLMTQFGWTTDAKMLGLLLD